MFCKNCGNPLKDGAKFCMNCGAKVITDDTRTEVHNDAPSPEEPVREAPQPAPSPTAVQTAPQPEPAPAPPQKAKKKKNKLVPVIIVAAVVAVLAVLVIFNFAKITNFFAKLFMKPDSYYHFVEDRNADILAQNIADVYSFGLFNNVENDNIKQEYSLKAELSDGGRDFLSEIFRIELPWLKSAMVKLSNSKNDDVNAPKIELFLNGKSVLNADAILDGTKGYIRIPDLSEKYFSLDLNEFISNKSEKPEYYGYDDYGYYYGDYGYNDYPTPDSSRAEESALRKSGNTIFSVFMSDLNDAIPDRETIRNLLSKYIKIALGELDDVEKGKSTLTACGVSNEYTTLEVTIDEKAVVRMITAVLKELKKDQDVKEMLKGFEKTFENDDLYEEFIESIDEALDSTDEISLDAKIKMTVWVGSSGEVVGREITIKPFGTNETIVLKMAMPVKGNKFGVEISYGLKGAETPYIMFSGSGTVRSNKMTGDFKLSVLYTSYEYEASDDYWGYNMITHNENIEVIKISTEDFDIKEVFNGHLKGKFTFEIPDDILKKADVESEIADIIKKTKG